MWYIIKLILSILVLGRLPKPTCRHSWGSWCVVRKQICEGPTYEYSSDRDYYGIVTVSRVCPDCGETQFREYFTGKLSTESYTTSDNEMLVEWMNELESNVRSTYSIQRSQHVEA